MNVCLALRDVAATRTLPAKRSTQLGVKVASSIAWLLLSQNDSGWQFLGEPSAWTGHVPLAGVHGKVPWRRFGRVALPLEPTV